MLVFAVWQQTSCHNELTRALVLAFVYRHWKWRISGRYERIYNIRCWVYTPEIIPWKLGPLTSFTGPADCPCGERETRRPSSGSHRWRHSIRHVTRIVTHAMDVNNRHGGSNYRCQACTFTIKRFHNLTKARELGKDKFCWCYNHRDNQPYFSPFLFSESLHYWNER